MSFNNLSVSRKLGVGFATVVVIVLVMCAMVFASLNAIRTATDANNVSTSTLAQADAALSSLVEQQNAVRAFVATGDHSFPPRIAKFQDDFAKDADALDALSGGGPLKAKVVDLRAEAAKVASEEAEQMALRNDPTTLSQAQASLLTKGRLTHSREILKSITDPEHALLAARGKAQAAAIQASILALGLGGLISAALAVVLGVVLSKGIAGPVSAMTHAMQKLAAGDVSVTVPAVGRKDEVGRMAGAVQTFKEAAIAQRALEAEAAAQRQAAEEARHAADEVRARTAE